MFVEKLNRDENPRFCRIMFSFVILCANTSVIKESFKSAKQNM